MDRIKVVVLNGPPGSGKDTIGKALSEWMKVDCLHGQFKQPLLEILAATLRVSVDALMSIYDNRELKETPLAIFGGHSIREAMIAISEDYIKPIFGKDYLGKAQLALLRKHKPNLVIYTDGGFLDELQPLLDAPEVELHVVHIHRRNCTFACDSRGYVTPSELADAIVHCDNDKSIGDAVNFLVKELELV